MKYIVPLMFLLLFGCSQKVMRADTSEYGPVMAKGQEGTVAYNPDGLDPIVEARRESALKRIYKACGNTRKYTIVKEETREPTDDEAESLSAFGAATLRFIQFRCGTADQAGEPN